jgi:hypothetical protein
MIHLLKPLGGAALDLLSKRGIICPGYPIRGGQHEVYKRCEGELAGLFSGRVAAHAVGHGHAIAIVNESGQELVGVDVGLKEFEKAAKAYNQEVIFIIRTHLADVGLTGNVDL